MKEKAKAPAETNDDNNFNYDAEYSGLGWSSWFISAYGNLLSILFRALSAAIGLTTIIIIFGWVRLISYTYGLSIDWLIGTFGFFDYIQYGAFPFCLFIFALLVTFSQVGDIFSRKLNNRRVKLLLIFISILIAISIGLDYFMDINIRLVLWSMLFFVTSAMVGYMISDISIGVKSNKKYHSETVYWSILMAIYPIVVLSSMGFYEGVKDSKIESTKLTQVVKNNGDVCYLIKYKEGLFYCIEYLDNEENKVLIPSVSDVQYITKKKIVTKESPE